MIKILFVCHGNICRSPMAEYVLKDMAQKAGVQLEIASVATSCEELGNPVYPPALRELQRHGIAVDNHRARQITKADVARFDRIYYMDSRNARNLARMFPRDTEKFQPFLHRDVADPWYSGDFTQTWLDIMEGCQRIMKEVL